LKGLIYIVFIFLLLSGCQDEKKKITPDTTGKIEFYFEHLVDQELIQFDTLIYTNEAGNPYLINEIQYFVSDIRLYKNDGSVKLIDEWKDIHYVDTDIQSTWYWEVFDKIDEGNYDSIGFTFGISEEKNISFMYVNPPEKDMFWPEYLGGGYHYMKLNGKWLPEGQTIQTIPFDFHLGIGQIYHSYPDSITGFVQNYFDVSLPASDFSIGIGEKKLFVITMHIENWFKEPHIYNHDFFGGYIMQNQDAMQTVKENGSNVFSFFEIKPD